MAGKQDIKAGRAFVELFTKDESFVKGLRNARKKLQDFGKAAAAMGKTLAKTMAAALTPVALAVKRFADFDDQMRAVKAVSQSTGEEFERLTAKAKELGASTSFTAVEVAALMAELGRAGFKAPEIDAMTESVLNLARATGTDAALSAGIMASVLNTYELGAAGATRVSDALTATANKTFNTVELLGDAMKYAGRSAADFGLSVEETLAIIGTLGNLGIQGEMAGTTVRRLLTITGAEAGKLKEIFGVEFLDAAKNARPLVDVLDEINTATKDLGTGERAAKFNEAFGLLGITGASAISKSAGSTRELLDAIREAGGISAATAKEMDAGIGGSFRKLLSAVEGVAISLGETLAPVIAKIAKAFTDLSGVAIKWIENNKETVVAVVEATAGMAALGAAVAAAGLAISAVASPVGVAMTAVAASIGLVAMRSEEFRDVVKTGFGEVLQAAKDTGAGIADALSAGDSELAWQIALKGIEVAWHDLLNAMLDAGEKFAEEFGNMIKEQLHPKRILERMPGYQLGRSLTGGDENAEPGPIERFGQYLGDTSAKKELEALLKQAEEARKAKKKADEEGKGQAPGSEEDERKRRQERWQQEHDRRKAEWLLTPEGVVSEAMRRAREGTESTTDFAPADMEEISRMDAITDAIRASLEDTAMGRAGVVSEAAKSGGASQAFFSAAAALASSQGSGNPMVREQQKNNKLVEELIQVDRDMLDALKENTLEVIA